MVKYIDKKLALSLLPIRDDNSNKGSFLKILNIAGCTNYSGAAYLSSISALKTGGGFITLACPDAIIDRISPLMPEVTYYPLKTNNLGFISEENKINNIFDYGVISLGCGIGTDIQTKNFMINTLNSINSNQCTLIDADGINNLAVHRGELFLKNTIITPHPKELSRLLNVSLDEIIDNREKYARITSQTYECITVLKGKNTIVTDGDEIFINTTGNSALAKAGTGDVLTGIISGFLSQHLSLFDAAKLGVFLHGLSGDLASDDLTLYSVLASDVIDYIPFAFDYILKDE